ncbi:MAG: hypothetical protein ACR2HH_02135 [Chthoniobacterales bacterium]
MPLTLDEIVEHKDRLHREIVERECLLAAFDVMHQYVTSGRAPKSMELGGLFSGLLPSHLNGELKELAAPAPVSPPRPAPPRYVNPELKMLMRGHDGDTRLVRWAIERMTDDYSLLDLAALLGREGRPLKNALVLTRLRPGARSLRSNPVTVLSQLSSVSLRTRSR